MQFCVARQTDPLQTDVISVIEFLTLLFEQNLSYNSLCVARSALASFLTLDGSETVSSHPLISRYLKGVFTLKPPAPRYDYIWDVRVVLDLLRKWSPATNLSLKLLTLKLVMLVALVTAQRSQTIHKLKLDCLKLTSSKAVFQIADLLKHSRPGNIGQVITLKAYPADKRLCVCHYLKSYIKATKIHRSANGVHENQLFISYRRPYGPVSKDTIARWIRVVMQKAGIDTDYFKPHSTRSASSSAASSSGVSVAKILKTVGWAKEATFSKYYKKPIVTHENNMAQKVLSLK